MIARFTSISILKWFVIYFAVIPFIAYVMPASVPLKIRDIIVWIVASLAALLFAEWAFSTRLPEKKDVIELLIVWFITSCVLSLGIDILMYGEPIFLLKSFETQFQYVLELAMIPLAAHIARKRRLAHASGEGLSS